MNGSPKSVEVGQRLTHPHEHDIRKSPRQSCPCRHNELFNNLTGGQIPREPRLAGCAERAAHCTSGLATQTRGDSIVVGHEHRLDIGAISETEDPLRRFAIVSQPLGDFLKGEGELLIKSSAKRLRQRRDGMNLGKIAIQTMPNLINAVARLSAKEFRQLLLGHVVTGWHPFRLGLNGPSTRGVSSLTYA